MTQTPQEQTKRITSWPRLIGLLLLLVVIIVGGSIAATVAFPADPAVEPERYVGVSFVGSAAGELVAVALLVWVLRRQGMALRHIGLGRPTTGVAVAAGIALAVAYAAITAAGIPAVVHSAFAVTGLKLLTVVTTVLIVGVVEEVIFRGYLITAVASMGHGRFVQVLASGVAFGLAHPTAPINMAFTFVLGIGLALVYLLGNRSLTPVIIAHMLVNLIIEPGLALGATEYIR